MPRRHGPKDWRPKSPEDPEQIAERLRTLAPSCVYDVKWDRNENTEWDGDPEEDPRKQNFEAFDVEFTLTIILGGILVTASSYLGSTWDDPNNIDADVGGYLPQKLLEVTEEMIGRKYDLRGSVPDELEAAQKYLKEVLKVRYDLEQRRRGRE